MILPLIRSTLFLLLVALIGLALGSVAISYLGDLYAGLSVIGLC